MIDGKKDRLDNEEFEFEFGDIVHLSHHQNHPFSAYGIVINRLKRPGRGKEYGVIFAKQIDGDYKFERYCFPEIFLAPGPSKDGAPDKGLITWWFLLNKGEELLP